MGATQRLLRFGVFELNLDTEELRKSGSVMKLAPQPFKLLAVLASHAGQVVTRDEIQKQLWTEETETDSEHVVNKCIKQIRNVLGDDSNKPLYIETLPRQGYRFIAPVVSKAIPAPRLQVVESESGEQVRPIPLRLASPGAASAPVAVVVAPSYPATDSRDEPALQLPQHGKSPRRAWRVGLVVASVALIALAGGGLYRYWRSHRPPVFTARDTIVLADFDNKTGDPDFDDALKQALTIQLEQSPYLNVLSGLKVAATLKLMNRSASEWLTEDLAREVCLRTNSKAVLTASISPLGRQYVIGLKAVNCSTGDVLAEAQKEVGGKEVVLKALDAVAASLRNKLGESLSSVQKYATPLEEATTSSLEALKAYSLGQKARFAKGDNAALPFYKRAVELDPNFAMPYAAMSIVYSDLNEGGRAAQNARKAYELREKVSDRERFSIEANYYLFVTGELEKAADVNELWQQTYPRDFVPYENLDFIFFRLGDWEKALQASREALRREPNNEINYLDLGTDYASLNRIEEAEAVYKQAEERNLKGAGLPQASYQLAFLKGNTAQMAQLAASEMGKPGIEDILLAYGADTEAWSGKLKSARELTGRAMDSARSNDAKEAAGTYQAAAALREVESGKLEQARADANAALKLTPNRDVQAMAALALARAGATAAAEKQAAELNKAFPLDTLVQRYWLPTIRAAAALNRKDPNRALEILKVTSPIELSEPTNFNVSLCPVYLRGEAYLMLHDGNAAAAEFQKFIDHYGLVVNFPWGVLARLGLARAYALSGDTAKAKAAYQDFLTLWEDADPDIPIYKQAKAEYAKLH